MVFYELVKLWKRFEGGKAITEYSCDCFLKKEEAWDHYDDEIWSLTRDHTEIPINEEKLIDLEEFYKIEGNVTMLDSAYDPGLEMGVMLLMVEDRKQFAGWEHKNIILRLLDWEQGGSISREDLILLIQKLLEIDFTQEELLSLGFKKETIEEAWGKMGRSLF